MQIQSVEVIPVELKLGHSVKMANQEGIEAVTAIFIRADTVEGQSAWGCGIAHLGLTGETPQAALTACHQAASLVPDLHPTEIEYSLAQLAPAIGNSRGAKCAYDLMYHDLLGLAANLPLYRLLGGYRQRIQTSVTIPLSDVQESVQMAEAYARIGFRMLKIKGGLDAEEDVQRVQAIHRTLPDLSLRLDPDGGYSVTQAIDVTRALDGVIEMIEQPTPGHDPQMLTHVTRSSNVPVMADQSVRGPQSALDIAANRRADGMSIKIGTCGGLGCARQIDGIARASGLMLMVSCLVEPALMTAAGLSFALSSPNVHYGDLDGHLGLVNDPTIPGFTLEEGWLTATDLPGLGCMVNLS